MEEIFTKEQLCNKSEYLYQSITDIQGTVRAIDAKLIAIIAFLVIPLTNIGKIAQYCNYNIQGWGKNQILFVFGVITMLLFAVSWFGALITAFKGLTSIDNPVVHLSDKVCPSGTYYNGGLFSIKWVDSIINRTDLKTLTTIDSQLLKLPNNNVELLRELLFEQHKIVYIRSIKMVRQQISFKLLLWFIFSGFCVWFTGYIFKLL